MLYIKNKALQRHRKKGAAAIIAMMFLMIFGSLAAAMAIVAQANLQISNSHLKINRALAAAETGMHYTIRRLNQATALVKTEDGVIDETNSTQLWDNLKAQVIILLTDDPHNLAEPYEFDAPNPNTLVLGGSSLRIGPIAVSNGGPTFIATFTPHPLVNDEGNVDNTIYNSSYYQRTPYDGSKPKSGITTPINSSNPLDNTWIRVRVTATDGANGKNVTRVIQMDFKMDKKIRFAILSKSRIMIGRNVMIEGPIGSRFIDTDLTHGHPVQMVSDFFGMDAQLDTALAGFYDILAVNDQDIDNRINLQNQAEIVGIINPAELDINNDGYIDDYDYFLNKYDTDGNGTIDPATDTDFDTENDVRLAEKLLLIDTFGDPARAGYNDGVINHLDSYAKIKGQIQMTSDYQSWFAGAANSSLQDYYQGGIHPELNQAPTTFESGEPTAHSFEPQDFDLSTLAAMTTNNFATQVATATPNNPSLPTSTNTTTFEAVPYGSAHPYDYYTRPVYKNITFTNVLIPRNTNALFINCKFIGVTYVDTDHHNEHEDYNYAGMRDKNNFLKYPDKVAIVHGDPYPDTKILSNNLRFDSCTFEGIIATDGPNAYTQARNKLNFTGFTQFTSQTSTNLTQKQKDLFLRSTVLAPHYSIEMGTFINPSAPEEESLELTGTIVAGVLDARGHIKIDGSLITTFEPISGEGPVLGETSPQFNTTLGYFPSSSGDLEAELPDGQSLGVIQIRYDGSIPLPDGILGPIELRALWSTYFEDAR